ncbi:MAG TPA: SDR family oxidoreductase, partial [Candidatus Saccharimonadales bacterium]|nr:SDR family oxidoreductase [Candidatus Saccharimonadales bacterium]
EIRRGGGVATFTRGDVSRAERVEMIVQAATYNFGGLDIVVNCAGAYLPGTILDVDERRWDRMLNTNLKGPYLVSRCAVPMMRERGGGSIVNLAGAGGLAGLRGASAYSASKGGLIALTRSMALDLAPDRIRVNAICPGPMEPPEGGADEAPGKNAPPAPEAVPLGRRGWHSDVAALALYLASDDSCWVTGSVFPVDGGLMAGSHV